MLLRLSLATPPHVPAPSDTALSTASAKVLPSAVSSYSDFGRDDGVDVSCNQTTCFQVAQSLHQHLFGDAG